MSDGQSPGVAASTRPRDKPRAEEARRLEHEIRRRRTFAIISHPDAGKTTLTEKLLLYGGAVHLAGSIKARRARRHAASDWMEMERERGISVTSSVMSFEYDGLQLNLLDTPGHEDFSEDTYRTLMAADSAIMLLDNRKGVEERTRQLFDVCRRRRVPIFTFVNKCDRVGAEPLQLLDDVHADLGIACAPVTWPIYRGSSFAGVFDRTADLVHLFERDAEHGQRRLEARSGELDDPEVGRALGPDVFSHLREELELLDHAGEAFDPGRVADGTLSPTFFGSALTNFGVEPFLRAFLSHAPSPPPRPSSAGPVPPERPAFTGFVFKIQANMDPKHRDRIAFVRVCSGRFEAGMKATLVRTGSDVRLAAPRQFLAQERTVVEEAWPGDVVGILDRGVLRIGDTLSGDGKLEFEEIPRFPPEHFARIRVPDPLRRQRLDSALRELSEEGAAQVFYSESLAGPAPIVGAVGMLQFDVLLHRLRHEYNVAAELDGLPYRAARWVTGPPERIRSASGGYGRGQVYDAAGRPLFVFESEWALRRTIEEEKELEFHSVPP